MLFADAARIIAALSALGQQFCCADDPKFGSAEYLGASLASAGADVSAAAVVGMRLATHKSVKAAFNSGSAGRRNLSQGLDQILWTLAVAETLELTTGFGPPYEGGGLKAGSDQFTTVSQQLGSVFPENSNWQGSAEYGYVGQNAEQQEGVQTIADLDRQLAVLVKDQADWVTHVRLGFGLLKELLIWAYATEVAINAVVVWSATSWFATKVSLLGVIAAIGMVTTLLTFSVLHGQSADELAHQYQDLAASVNPVETSPHAGISAVVESVVPHFGELSRTSDLSAMPDIATLAGLAGGSRNARPSLAAWLAEETEGVAVRRLGAMGADSMHFHVDGPAVAR